MESQIENQETEKKKVVALYIRVSTNLQVSGMESQMRALTDFCEKNWVQLSDRPGVFVPLTVLIDPVQVI